MRTLTNPSSSLLVFYGIYPQVLWWFSGLFCCGIVKLSLYHECYVFFGCSCMLLFLSINICPTILSFVAFRKTTQLSRFIWV
jgi:hypothetical protein